jgi:hypothetical protein
MQKLPMSIKRRVRESPCQQYVELATPRIIGSGESIFDYKYLRKFESKIEKATTILHWTSAETIYI